MRKERVLSPQMVAVLDELSCGKPSHGFELMKRLGWNSGTMYPVLVILEKRDLIERLPWEPKVAEKGPPKRPVRITETGRKVFLENVGRIS